MEEQSIQQNTLLRCCDCGEQYTLGVGEAAWYREHGMSWPKRCSRCRRRRKQGLPPLEASNGE